MSCSLNLPPLPNSVPQTFASLLNPIVTLFANTLNNLSSTIKRALQKHTFLALSAYGELASCQSQWDNVMRSASRKENELKDGLQTLRSTMLRSFPEFLVDIKTAAIDANEMGSGTAPITTSTITYLNQIPPVQGPMAAALSTLGDGNWRMGEGMSKTGQRTNVPDTDESGILENYIRPLLPPCPQSVR